MNKEARITTQHWEVIDRALQHSFDTGRAVVLPYHRPDGGVGLIWAIHRKGAEPVTMVLDLESGVKVAGRTFESIQEWQAFVANLTSEQRTTLCLDLKTLMLLCGEEA